MSQFFEMSDLNLSRRALGALTVATLATAHSLPSLAQQKAPEEGTDYIKLDKAAQTEGIAGKVEVVEFFWYNCPHCNAFEPTLNAWLKKLPKDVHFRRVPVAFRAEFVPQQHLFYTLEAMGKVAELHSKIFAAIHAGQQDLSTRPNIIAWVGKQGIKGLDMAKFTQIFDSFATGSKATRATQLQESYRVSGVPALGIAGQFYTDGGMAQGMDRALKVVDYLVSTQRKPVAPKKK